MTRSVKSDQKSNLMAWPDPAVLAEIWVEALAFSLLSTGLSGFLDCRFQ
jgi:hypothetical protein